jgi:Ca2+-binding EF-hand superfamily protein
MRQNTDDNTLTQEIGAALSMRLFFEKGLSWKNYFIYFEPKNSKQEDALKQIGTSLNFDQLKNFMDTYAEQNTPIDFSFVNKDVDPAEVFQIQFKIFGIGIDPTSVNEQLVEYLKKIKTKYAKTEASLLLQFRNKGTLDFSNFKNLLDETFPFKEVILFTFKPDGGLTFCQLYQHEDEVKCIDFTKDEMLGL